MDIIRAIGRGLVLALAVAGLGILAALALIGGAWWALMMVS